MLIDYLLKGTAPKWSYWFCNVRYGVRLWPVISQKWRWCSGRYNKQTLASITWWLRMTLAHQRSPLYYMQPTTVHTRGKHQLAEWNNCNSCLLSLLIVSTIHTIVHLLSWAALEEIFFKNCNIAAISVKTSVHQSFSALMLLFGRVEGHPTHKIKKSFHQHRGNWLTKVTWKMAVNVVCVKGCHFCLIC